MATNTENQLGPRPEPPSQENCCRGDCAPNCVFDIYERELERWQLALERSHQAKGIDTQDD
ncbi:MAG: oxidoreductase-like domain-containing protein [Stagnimonas sp.]|nr:oxidoreductase-like domain-containing protein [Stagnimonas sp.]